MFRQIFGNIPDVTKNLLILNVLFFLAKIVLMNQGIDLNTMLSMHYPFSNVFEPYQVITHFFMHGDLMHILFNMIGLVVFGSMLERFWGKKRYFIFYVVTALGGAILYEAVQMYELYQLVGSINPDITITDIQSLPNGMTSWNWNSKVKFVSEEQVLLYREASAYYARGSLGASGAVYGLILGVGYLFPNTEFLLYFTFKVKAKWIAIALGVFALYQGFQNNPGDSVAHMAHLGGMLFGFIMIKVWQRNKNTFY
ncbi:rhomboid family intramembrane serine protease [Crocinitomicaceae bacterium]|nr:rhomboid family intramembrane serine protease [Crocinitomicaceae bacterium]